ncbi:MAG: ComF family protein [Candidatus Rifleibacteriota bacterium]
MGILEDFFEAFFPFRCHICGTLTSFRIVLCEECEGRLAKTMKPPFVVEDVRCKMRVETLSEYDSFISDIIRIIKYRPSRRLIEHLFKVIASKNLLAPLYDKNLIFIPVPMHSKREFNRGFNQAGLIAEFFAKETGNHYSPALQRIRETRPQAECDEEERLHNLDAAISLSKGLIPAAFKGKNLVIVDDVVTTGITMENCRKALLGLRPASISALAISHSFKSLK